MICRSRDVCSVNKVAITNNVGAQYKKSKFSLLCKDHAVGMTDMGSEVNSRTNIELINSKLLEGKMFPHTNSYGFR